MAEFQGIFASLSAVSIHNRGVGGMGGEAGGMGWSGWGGRWQKAPFVTPMSSHGAHTVPSDTIVSLIVSRRRLRSPLPNWHPPWVLLFQP